MRPVQDDPTDSQPTQSPPPHPSLEETALSSGPSGAWVCKLYRQAGEATLWRATPPLTTASDPRAEPTADERAAIAGDSARRAAGEVRRYIRANRLDHLWTFTFEKPVHDYAELAPIIARFLRRLWDANWRGALVLVPEPHPKGHGWHLHAAIRGRFPHRVMARLWGQGFVFVTGPHGQSRSGWRPRKLSSYLAKYLVKELDLGDLAGCTPRATGEHRYFRTQGHDPIAERWTFGTLRQALTFLEHSMGMADVMLPFAGEGRYRPEGYWLAWPDPPRRARSGAP